MRSISRYMLLWLYWEYGTRIWVVVKTPTVEKGAEVGEWLKGSGLALEGLQEALPKVRLV